MKGELGAILKLKEKLSGELSAAGQQSAGENQLIPTSVLPHISPCSTFWGGGCTEAERQC